jgi:hypothetical protein
MDKKQVAQLLAMLQTHYPLAYKSFDTDMLKIAVESWHYGMHDLDASLVFNVVSKMMAIDESDFPPKMATIRKECLKAMNPTSLIPPETAWETARKTVIKYGRYNKDKGMAAIDNPSIKRALQGVGWDRIGDASDEDIGFVKSDFIKLYNEVDIANKEQYLVPKGTLAKLETMAAQKHLEHRHNELPEV